MPAKPKTIPRLPSDSPVLLSPPQPLFARDPPWHPTLAHVHPAPSGPASQPTAASACQPRPPQRAFFCAAACSSLHTWSWPTRRALKASFNVATPHRPPAPLPRNIHPPGRSPRRLLCSPKANRLQLPMLNQPIPPAGPLFRRANPCPRSRAALRMEALPQASQARPANQAPAPPAMSSCPRFSRFSTAVQCPCEWSA